MYKTSVFSTISYHRKILLFVEGSNFNTCYYYKNEYLIRKVWFIIYKAKLSKQAITN